MAWHTDVLFFLPAFAHFLFHLFLLLVQPFLLPKMISIICRFSWFAFIWSRVTSKTTCKRFHCCAGRPRVTRTCREIHSLYIWDLLGQPRNQAAQPTAATRRLQGACLQAASSEMSSGHAQGAA